MNQAKFYSISQDLELTYEGLKATKGEGAYIPDHHLELTYEGLKEVIKKKKGEERQKFRAYL